MPDELTPNTREFRYEKHYRMFAPLNWEIATGVFIHVEFEVTEKISDRLPTNTIMATMNMVIEGAEWGQGGRENYNGKYLGVLEDGANFEITTLNIREINVSYNNESEKVEAINLINEWIDERHKEIYDRYISKKMIRVIVK